MFAIKRDFCIIVSSTKFFKNTILSYFEDKSTLCFYLDDFSLSATLHFMSLISY